MDGFYEIISCGSGEKGEYMTKNESKEIALSLSFLLEAILSDEYNPEEVANSAIDSARDIINRNPKIKEWVEGFFEPDTESENFKQEYDREMKLIMFLRSL